MLPELADFENMLEPNHDHDIESR